MTYRNDHEAALLRIGELEYELEKIKGHLAPPPARARPKTRARHLMLLTGGIFAAGCIIAAILHFQPTRSAPTATEGTAVPEAIDDPVHQVCALP